MGEAKVITAYRPCVGVMLLNRQGLVWIGRRFRRSRMKRAAANGGRCRKAASTRTRTRPLAPLRELYEETAVRSAEIIAEAPEWYKYDLPDRSHRQVLERQISRPDAEMVRRCASPGTTAKST